MISRTSRALRQRFRLLPHDVQRRTRTSYQLWTRDPHHSSLRFWQVRPAQPIYSVHIGRDWRALGLRQTDDRILWFWIGSNAD